MSCYPLKKVSQPAAENPVFPPGRLLSPGETISLQGRTYRITSAPLPGRRGMVYRIEDSAGRRFALKTAADRRRETLLSLRGERRKARTYRRWGFPHAGIVASGPDYVLKEWVDGIRGDAWAREWARQGFPPGTAPWVRLTELVARGISLRVYLRDLNQNNLIWDGAGWMIIDAGSAKKLFRRSRVRRLYLEEIPLNWGRATDPNSEEPIRELLESVLAAR